MNLRFDLILSYWIFAWFLLYLYDVVPYSPHLALILALLFEIGILCAMVFNHASNYYIGLFVIITIIIKAMTKIRIMIRLQQMFLLIVILASNDLKSCSSFSLSIVSF